MNVLKIVGYLSAIAMVGLSATASAAAFPLATTIAVPLSPLVALRDLGRAPANYPVSIVVTLPYRHPAQLEQLVESQGDPDSPLYHHFLTTRQFASIYGPTPQDEMTVIALLQRAGFTVIQRSSNRTVLDASAPAAVAERYFKTEIHLALQPGSGPRYLNTRPAVIPQELLARTFSVSGLNDIRIAPAVRRTANTAHADASRVGAPLENEGGFGPLPWAAGYDLPIQHGIDGTHVKIAELLNAAPIPSGLIQTYVWAFDLPMPTGETGAKTTLVRVDGGCPTPATVGNCSGSGDLGWDAEFYDEFEEFLAALAPGADAYLYQIPDDTLTSYEDGFNKIVADNKADIATTEIEYFESEPNAETFAVALDHVIQQGNALGITFITESLSALDVASCGCAPPSIPADSPHVLAVGASNLQVDSAGKYHSEAAFLSGFNLPAISAWFPEPSYATGIKGVPKNGRFIPDLVSGSLVERSTAKTIPPADFTGQFTFYEGPGWSSSPSFGYPYTLVALVADIDQMNGSRSGLINTTIYKLYKKQKYGPTNAPAFRNITRATPGTKSPNFPTTPGFNLPTGIGSVVGWNLANDLKEKK
jgi:subtilase family serine protease